MKKFIDLRSDTVTQPTQEMREAMYRAEVGDDILGEDITVRELETMAASILGKEDGLFVTSGTLANQVAVMTFTNRGEEVIIGDTSHMYNLEVAALASLSQVQGRPISVPNGVYDLDIMEDLIQEEGIQKSKTSLICIEDTNNLNAGMVVPLHNINAVCELGKKHEIPIYMDGARIFNAVIASGIEAREIVKNVDAVMFALSKGLSAPFGAVLTGSKEFIEKGRWIKQRLGGGFRQAGFMAAPGIVALKTMIPRIAEDHENARILAKGIAEIGGLSIDLTKVHTNIVTASIESLPITVDELLAKLLDKSVKAKRISKNSFRMVTHIGIEESHIQYVISTIKEIIYNL